MLMRDTGAGATMCGVTRLSITLAVILFELTGSLDYVLPFSLSILAAKWTADAIEPLSIYVSSPHGGAPDGVLPQGRVKGLASSPGKRGVG